MGRHRRSEVQILTDILSAALRDVGVTHLMYKANWSYSTLLRYLSAALNKRLIIQVFNGDGSMVYRTTDKGRTILERLRDVRTLLQSTH